MATVVMFCLATTVMAQPGQGRGERGERGQRGGERGERGGPGGGERGERGGRMMQASPVMAALDADKDGVISKAEIDNATAVLRKLDTNGDGELGGTEMRPKRPGGGEAGGPGGERAGRGAQRDAERGGERGEKGAGRERGGKRGGEKGTDGARGRKRGGEKGADDARGGKRGAEKGADGARKGKRGERGEKSTGAGNLMKKIMSQDKNDDGKISKEEAPERMTAMFDRVDGNSDGFLDETELEAMASRLSGRNRGQGAGGRRGGGDDSGKAQKPKRPKRDK